MRISLLLVTLLVACTDADKGENQESVPPSDDTAPPDDAQDADGDGWDAAEDCDDGDAAVNPGAEEACDGLDNDCDTLTDDADDSVAGAGTWYTDSDGDGYGDAATVTCDPPAGAVSVGGDCDDTNASVHPDAVEADCADPVDYNCDGSTGYVDADGDGSPACEDCDDGDATANPEAREVCDGVDNDCDATTDESESADAETWYADTDGDGYGDASEPTVACEAPDGYVASSDDCDDTASSAAPDATEVCDGLDNNCDGEADEASAADAGTWYTDGDGDGYGDPDSATVACEAPEGTVSNAEDCDDADAELSPDTTWYIDADGDGYGSDSYTTNQCEAPDGYLSNNADCDDLDEDVHPDAEEVCNALDDDCDGLVDDADSPVSGTSTWYADTDEDGYGDPDAATQSCEVPAGYGADAADCDDSDDGVSPDADEGWYDAVDSDCDGNLEPSVCDSLPDASAVATDDTCTVTYGSSWSVSSEWTTDSSTFYSTANSYSQVMMTPVVGNLDDDNGDGLIDELDIPDVAYTSFTSSKYSDKGYLRVIEGDGSGDWLNIASVKPASTTYYVNGSGGVAIGDLEGDGSPDIATISTTGEVLVFENDGTLKWLYDGGYSESGYPSIADMDGDGQSEVIVGPQVLSSTGALVGECAYGNSGYISFAADIDLDGDQELIVGPAVCDMDGGLVWSSGRTQGWPGVGNFDSDPEAEIVNVDKSNDRVDLLDDDGTLLWSTSISGGGGGPPVVGDFDGDGEQEIGVGAAKAFVVLEASGTVKWKVTIDDSSSEGAGASAFDFDADGASEIIYADENEVYIFDGSSGAELWTSTSHQSGTRREFPVVADVDRDGQAEVVLASNDYGASGWAGIHVLGETSGAWPSARLAFNQHAYDLSSVTDDLSVVADGTSWSDPGTLRGQSEWSDTAGGAPDLAVQIIGGCEDCTTREVDLYAVIDNTGPVFAPEGLTVSVYAVSGSTRTLLDSTTTTEPIWPGERTAPIRFTLPLSSLGSDGVVVVVDDDDALRECDTADNEATWDAATCP